MGLLWDLREGSQGHLIWQENLHAAQLEAVALKSQAPGICQTSVLGLLYLLGSHAVI